MATRILNLLALRLLAATAGLLASMQSHAQFDGKIYGVADFSYGRFQSSGQAPDNRFNSNSLAASHVGVEATNSLEGGITPGLVLESFVRFQDFKLGRRDSDPVLSRNAFLFVDSRYGRVRAGRLQTALFDLTARFNAFGNSAVFSPSVKHLFNAGVVGGVQGDFYWDQAIGYQTPKGSSPEISLMTARGDRDVRGTYIGGTFIGRIDRLTVGLGLQNIKISNGFADPTNESVFALGVSLNEGDYEVFGQYSHTKDKGIEAKSNVSTAGLRYSLLDGFAILQVAQTQAKGAAINRKQTTSSVGYLYPLQSFIPYVTEGEAYLLGMDDQVGGQLSGRSVAGGIRVKF